MFYYLIYNSALGNYQEHSKRYLTTFLYGSILYLIIHAYLYSSSNTFHQSLRLYFWVVWLIDILSIVYISYYLEEQLELEDGSDSTLKSLLGDLKDKISSKKEKHNEKNNNNLDNNNSLEDKNQDINENNLELRVVDNSEEDENLDNFGDNLNSFLDDIGSTLIDKPKKDIDQRALVYNPNEFDIPNHFEQREDSQSPVFSDFGSEDDGEMSGSDLDLDDFRASLET